jgi:hypothetical protein
MFLALILSASADTITLDSGALIEGDLARYEFGGDCQISVTEGDLRGVILIVPCHRVQAFVRTDTTAPVPIGLAAPVGPKEEVAPVAARPAPVAVQPAPVAAEPAEVATAPTAAEPAEADANEPADVAMTPAVVESEPAQPRPAPSMGTIDAAMASDPAMASQAPPPARKPVSF